MHLHIFQWKPFISPWHNSAPSHWRKQNINLTRGATENIKVKTEFKRREKQTHKLFTTSRSYLPWKGAEQPLILKEVNTVRSFTKDLTMSAVCWTHQAQNTAITDKLTFIFQHSFDWKLNGIRKSWTLYLNIASWFPMIIDKRQINILSNASSKSETPLKAKTIGCFIFYVWLSYLYIVYVIIHVRIWYKMIFWRGWNCTESRDKEEESKTDKRTARKGKVVRHFVFE